MTSSHLFFIIITVILLSTGQILFKLASASINLSAPSFAASLLNIQFFVALIVYFFATIMWLLVLKEAPLRQVYPFSALAFFVVPVMSHFFLGEDLAWNTFTGGILIVAGVLVSVYR